MNETIKRVRMDPQTRHEQILNIAMSLALVKGYKNITRDEIAESAHISKGLIGYYWPTVEALRAEVLKTAIENEIIPIIAQNLSVKGKESRLLNPELKKKVINYLIN